MVNLCTSAECVSQTVKSNNTVFHILMHANATNFHYMHTSKDTDTDFQCDGINIKSENIVKMLGINIDKKN